MQNLAAQGVQPGNFTYFYVDVEECDPQDNCWQTAAVNRQYLLDVVKGLQDGGASVGIYASTYEWNLVMGSDLWSSPALTALPLWYASWDGIPGMGSFSSFGGWPSPHMHQFADQCSVCYNVDQNFLG
jgi:GH25 family lysozyme M1 (1,4-beta-N-acetylmuramidase)